MDFFFGFKGFYIQLLFPSDKLDVRSEHGLKQLEIFQLLGAKSKFNFDSGRFDSNIFSIQIPQGSNTKPKCTFDGCCVPSLQTFSMESRSIDSPWVSIFNDADFIFEFGSNNSKLLSSSSRSNFGNQFFQREPFS